MALPKINGRVVGGENDLHSLGLVVNLLLHTDRPLPRLAAGGVAQERAQHSLDVEGVPAVETHDDPQVRVTVTSLTKRGTDAQHSGHSVLDALHQRPETVLYHGALLDLVPVLVQEGTLQGVRQVLTLLSQPEAVLL